jgi:hypothetical protein
MTSNLFTLSSGSTMQYHSIFRSGLFAGQTVIVTGGGSGLGRCTGP